MGNFTRNSHSRMLEKVDFSVNQGFFEKLNRQATKSLSFSSKRLFRLLPFENQRSVLNFFFQIKTVKVKSNYNLYKYTKNENFETISKKYILFKWST